MDLLLHLISSKITNQDQAEWIVIGLVLLVVFILILVVLLLISAMFDPVRAKFLSEKGTNYMPLDGGDKSSQFLQTYSHIIMPSNAELTSRTTQRLHHAGYHAKRYILQYFAIRILLMICLPLITFFLISVIPAFKTEWLVNALLISLAVGFVLPSFVLDKQIAKRQKNIQHAFPDGLDMLVICTEAGLSLDAAIQRLTEEMRFSHPILADEFSIVVAEIQAGADRKKALKGLADRTGVKDIKGLMATLTQCMTFGTSVSDALRIYSDDLRDRRMQAAEEIAAKIGAKLIFPLAVCLLPAFLLIVMAPLFLALTKAIAQ